MCYWGSLWGNAWWVFQRGSSSSWLKFRYLNCYGSWLSLPHYWSDCGLDYHFYSQNVSGDTTLDTTFGSFPPLDRMIAGRFHEENIEMEEILKFNLARYNFSCSRKYSMSFKNTAKCYILCFWYYLASSCIFRFGWDIFSKKIAVKC